MCLGVTQAQDKLVAESREKRTVIVDVGGERFIAARDVLNVFPATRSNKNRILNTVNVIEISL